MISIRYHKKGEKFCFDDLAETKWIYLDETSVESITRPEEVTGMAGETREYCILTMKSGKTYTVPEGVYNLLYND